MTIPNEWLKDGAIVPVNNETVRILIEALTTASKEKTMSHFEEVQVIVHFHVAINRFDNFRNLSNELQERINKTLGEYFNTKQRGTYTNPLVTVKKECNNAK